MERREFVEDRPGWREEYGDYASKWAFFGGQAAFLAEHLPALEQGELRLLDVGCAYGMFLRFLHAMNPRLELHGMEVAHEAAEVAGGVARETGGSVAWQGCGDPFPFEADSFDAVVSFDMIEHVADNAALARMSAEAARVLKPGGMLFLETPNYNRRMQWLHKLTGQGHMLRWDHCNLFGEERLGDLVRGAGLELVGVAHRGGWWAGPKLPDVRVLWPKHWVSAHLCAVGRKR